MDNVFITQYFDWNAPEPRRVRLLNALLRAFRINARVIAPHGTGATTSVEQRMNMFHLLRQVLKSNVPGDIVEIGSDVGTSAALLEKVLCQLSPQRRLHVYDLFPDGREEKLLANFTNLQLRPPIVHRGWIEETVPAQLPEQIAFAHLDLGPGASPDHLRKTMGHSIESIYPRLSPGAICLVADYCVPAAYQHDGFSFPRCIRFRDWWNLFPTVRPACDEFLSDKPEKMMVLYSGDYSHAFFEKR